MLGLQSGENLALGLVPERPLHRQAAERVLQPEWPRGRELKDRTHDVVARRGDPRGGVFAGTHHAHMVGNGTDVPR